MGSYTGQSRAAKAIRGLTRNSIRDGEVIGKKLHDDVLSGHYFKFKAPALQPFLFLADNSGPATGADGVYHMALLPGTGHWIYYAPIGAATVLGPVSDVLGLIITMDATNAEGANYMVTAAQGQMVVDADASDNGLGMFIRARLKIADVSANADVAVGFRKNEPVQADIENYAEMAAVNVQNGTVNSDTILGSAADVVVDSGLDWADGEEHEIMVTCQPTGVCRFYFDGAELPVTQPFTFADAEQIVPFIYVINEAASNGAVYLTLLEVGTLEQV